MNQRQELLNRIIHHLILNASFTRNLGLLDGKMGICIFFYLYARQTGSKLYEELGGYLLDEIYKEIAQSASIGFAKGLCGVAWGIEYLIQNNFVEADRDEVLEELDLKILEKDVTRIKDFSLDNGLKGIAYYVINRYYKRINPHELINKEYINSLICALKQNKEDEEAGMLVNKLSKVWDGEIISDRETILEVIVDKTTYTSKTLFNTHREIGIRKNGYTGIALKLIFENHEK